MGSATLLVPREPTIDECDSEELVDGGMAMWWNVGGFWRWGFGWYQAKAVLRMNGDQIELFLWKRPRLSAPECVDFRKGWGSDQRLLDGMVQRRLRMAGERKA